MSISVNSAYTSTSAYTSSVKSLTSSSSSTSQTQESQDQFSQMIDLLSQGLFSSLDTDSSNGIDSTEFSAAAQELLASSSSSTTSVNDIFSSMDSDQDGSISQSELKTALTESMTAMQQSGMMPPPGGMPPPPPPSGDQKSDEGYTADELTTKATETASSDSKLSELFSELASNFDAADTNGDGKVDASEARAYQDSKQTQTASTTATSSTQESGQANVSDFQQALLSKLVSYYAQQSASASTSTTSLLGAVSA